MNQHQNPYDAVPYGDRVHPHTHPDRLCAIGRLFGLSTADPRRARVLELGCASGGNLIPIAYNLPESQFVGIDLSGRQIASGQERISDLGLTNIELRKEAIEDFPAESEAYDYIICHGIFSWVSDAARDRIFEVCEDHLAEHGVALVSFNTLPGWNLVKSVRDMMRYHTRQFDDPGEKTGQARALLEFLSQACGDDDSAYATLIRQELKLVSEVDDAYLLHDHLADLNRPTYFHEFIKSAGARGLQYLADSDLATMLPENLSETVAAKLREIGDIVRMEQYLDYLRGRRFRNTLLCRAEAPVDRDLGGEALTGLRLTARFAPDAPLEEAHLESGVEVGLSVGRARLGVRDRQIKTALKILFDAHPMSVSYEELIAGVAESDAGSVEELRRRMDDEANLVRLVFANAIEISSIPPAFTDQIAERPLASRLARLQAECGSKVANQRHEPIGLGPADRVILQALDGSSTVDDLPRLLSRQVESGELRLQIDGGEADSSELVEEALTLYCRSALARFSSEALLIENEGEQEAPPSFDREGEERGPDADSA